MGTLGINGLKGGGDSEDFHWEVEFDLGLDLNLDLGFDLDFGLDFDWIFMQHWASPTRAIISLHLSYFFLNVSYIYCLFFIIEYLPS